MKHTKICMLLVTALVLVSSCCAYADDIRLGMLSKTRDTVEVLSTIYHKDGSANSFVMWRLPRLEDVKIVSLKYYDNLISLIMGLNADEINAISAPKLVAEYILSTNPDYVISAVTRIKSGAYLSFGFKKLDGVILQKNFNTAIHNMRKDGTLDELTRKYCLTPGTDGLAPVKFETFDRAETVKIAVTGDLPPIDYVAPDGTPAGFSTAILAEIGRRLKINIQLVHTDTGARTAALMSGRVDGVFWYQFMRGLAVQTDAPENVIFSEPYYEWDTNLNVSRKRPEK